MAKLTNCYLSRIKRNIEVEEDVLTTGSPLPEDVMKKIKSGKFQTFSTGKPEYRGLAVAHTIPFDIENFKASYKAVKITLTEAREEQAKAKESDDKASKKK